jgi:hypothetical protein
MSVIKQGLKGSNLISNNIRKTKSNINNTNTNYGKVYGVVNGINLPTPKMYNKVGGRIGTIFYLDANASKLIDGEPFNNTFLDTCLIAYSFTPNTQYYPLVGEIVEIKSAPSIDSGNTPGNKLVASYWNQVINLFGNEQQNSQLINPNASLGKTFIESNSKNLISYEGDYILSGRKGNSIRFGSTVGSFSIPSLPNYNEWSIIGQEGSPILILSNGHNYSSNTSSFYTEKINEDESSIYLTSDQALPINTDLSNLKSPIYGEPTFPNIYNKSQVILNGNRILINSKKDEIMLFAKTNTIIKSNNINLIGNSVQLSSEEVYLGQNGNDLPDEPILLGFKTIDLLTDLISVIQTFTTSVSPSVDSMGGPIAALKTAADRLNIDLDKVKKKLDINNPEIYIASKKIYAS